QWASPARVQGVVRRVLGGENNPNPQLSVDQQLALDYVAGSRGQDRLFLVLPTGAGKSMLYTIAAALQNKCVVILVPFVVLEDQVLAKLKAAGLSAESWDYSRHAQQQLTLPRAIIASVDTAVKKNSFSR